MQRLCHEFDLNFGGTWEGRSMIPSESRERYLVSSLMEEAIYSSMMEGAVTTRKVAKEMLRRKITPKDKSQQMIHNNYQTIQFIVANKYNALTPELVMHIHQLMTDKTLDDPEDAGRLRTNDNVVVENGITHEIVHQPPSYQVLPELICATTLMKRIPGCLSTPSSGALSSTIWWHTCIPLLMVMDGRRAPCSIGICSKRDIGSPNICQYPE